MSKDTFTYAGRWRKLHELVTLKILNTQKLFSKLRGALILELKVHSHLKKYIYNKHTILQLQTIYKTLSLFLLNENIQQARN